MINSNTTPNRPNYPKTLTLFFTVALTLLLSWQCISPPDFLGGDILPPEDRYGVNTDTSFVLSAFTEPYDTAHTTNFIDAVLGQTFDPVYGRTKASFITQLRLSVPAFSYKTFIEVDSAFLFLQLKDKLGDEQIVISVHELADSLVADSSYNALAPIDDLYYPEPISEGRFITYSGEEPTLKIPINKDWVYNKLILADTTIMSSNDNFLKHLYGLYVKTVGDFPSHGKGMYYFDYPSALSRLVVHFKNEEQEVDTVSLSYTYVLDEQCIRYNHFEHDFSMIDPSIGLSFNSRENPQDSVFYLKALGGARGVIRLDDIESWIDSMPVAINRAQLIIELEENDNLPADSLINSLLLYKKRDGYYYHISDYTISTETFGGRYSKVNKHYSFNITNHLQELISKQIDDNILYVEPSLAFRRANGAVLRSGSHSNRMKLIITYTKL